MFVRAKEVDGKRYAYLVEGRRTGKRVRQETVCYLGPLSTLAAGVPSTVRRRVEEKVARIRVNWKAINDQIRRIPLTFEEMSEMRLRQYVLAMKPRNSGSGRGETASPLQPKALLQQRAEGELVSLSRLARLRFSEMFEEIGQGGYRMR